MRVINWIVKFVVEDGDRRVENKVGFEHKECAVDFTEDLTRHSNILSARVIKKGEE